MSRAGTSFAETYQRLWYAKRGKVPRNYLATSRAELVQFFNRCYDINPPEAAEKSRTEFVRERLTEFQQWLNQCPTRYENPIDYNTLIKLAAHVRTAAEDMADGPTPDWPVLATLFTGEINAMAIKVPTTTEHVIFFDSGLFPFALLLSKAVLQTVPLKRTDGNYAEFTWDEDAICDRIERNHELQYRFYQVLAEYSLSKRPIRTEPYLPEGHYQGPINQLIESMEMFVLGHEYGHVMAGHLTAPDVTRRHLAEADAELIEYSWPRELEADSTGVRLMMLALHKRESLALAFCYWGADFFFTALDIVQRAALLVQYGDETHRISSHPPPLVRRQAVRARMLEMVGLDRFDEAMHVSRCLELATERLWVAVRDSVFALRTYGARELPTFRENVAQLKDVWDLSRVR